ncbi:MAG: hypothetical protein U0U67_11210 [Chitinophagales bacterium]
MKTLTLMLLGILFMHAKAGEVFLCKSYNAKSKPKTSQIEWRANKDNICIVYNHDDKFKDNAVYRLSIAKRVEKYFFARFINKDIKVLKGSRTTIAYSKIDEPGDYIISIIDDKGFILGEQFCTIH